MRDEHCHIIWDVDDGASLKRQSIKMLRAAADAGIDEMVCTPHMRWDDFDKAKVEDHFAQLKELGRDLGIKMTLGYEVFYRTLLKIGIERAPEFVTQGTNNILIEFNTGGDMTHGWDRTFYELQSKYGLEITLAHPERYVTIQDDFDYIERVKDMGCRIQVSAGDLFDGFFSPMQRVAKRLIKEGYCDAIVSDAHCVDHYSEFAKAIEKYGE